MWTGIYHFIYDFKKDSFAVLKISEKLKDLTNIMHFPKQLTWKDTAENIQQIHKKECKTQKQWSQSNT